MHRMISMNAKTAPARHLTVRNVAPDLSRALYAERRRRGTSLNRAVLDLLRRALGLEAGRPYANGLGKFAGDWTAAEARRFERDIAVFEQIDEDLWK